MKLSQRRMARPSLGGLLATRQGALTVALLCAVSAAGIIFFSLSRYKANLRTPTPQATVLVSTAEIPKGTAGNTIASEKLYTSTPVAATQVTPGAISDASVLAGETAQTTILPGQQLTTTDFTARTGVAGVLTPGQRAISVTIDEAHGDTDVLQPGDHVDIYTTFNVSKTNSNATNATMILLVPDALVLKPASATPVLSGGKSITGSTLVLSVSAAQAPQVGFAADNGKLFLALRPTNASPPSAAIVTQRSIIASALSAATALSAKPALGSNTTTNNGAH
ncbi:MAG: Flp pilus assembly protein CpaB [Trebonia sp.]